MSISSEEAAQINSAVGQLRENPRFQNIVAQTQSRYVLQDLQVSSNRWPNYTIQDQQVDEFAHYLLWQGLQLKEFDTTLAEGNSTIKQGCELLEFLYSEQEESIEKLHQLFNAALGYYISGYYARSYVLMRQIDQGTDEPTELTLLRYFFSKNFSGMRILVLSTLGDSANSDEMIASRLNDEEITSDQALHNIFLVTFSRAFSFFLEYPKSGERTLLEQALELLNDGIHVALKAGFVDWWWLFYCTRYLFNEYDSNSFWSKLAPFGDGGSDLHTKYILANYARTVPIIELWPSQVKALTRVIEEERGSYCLKMPTSSGKTRIAELTILQFLLDYENEPDAKCIYIAPFRSLAVEIEVSLRKSFRRLNVTVSELYGGFELSPIERFLVDQTRILVATPEKFDAYLRYNPELADSVKLIIVDEGHIINLTERGVRYEGFLHRIIRRFRPKNARFLFISAVLPNTDEFAAWITESRENVVESDWRPSRMLVGEMVWDGRSVRINYLESDHSPLGYDCFIPNFLRPIDPRPIPGIQYRSPFPNPKSPSVLSEIVAEAGVRFAQLGATMIFCARKVSIVGVANNVLKSLKIHNALAQRRGREFVLPTSTSVSDAIEECLKIANEYMGSNNNVSKFLQHGIAIHYGDIPKPVRIVIEKLIRSGAVNLLIATTTLAQGVNLPMQTVIVHGLSHGYGSSLTPVTFWNTCGRAGRGMYENQGQVLFAVDNALQHVKLDSEKAKRLPPPIVTRRTEFKRNKQLERNEQARQRIIAGYRDYRVRSAFLMLLEALEQHWEKNYPNISFAELCQKLAENEVDWLPEGKQTNSLTRCLDVLDSELVALVEESQNDNLTPDTFQELFQNSLMLLQIETPVDAQEPTANLANMLIARWTFIRGAAPDPETINRFYRLGFPIKDCVTIELERGQLLEILRAAQEYLKWGVDERQNYFVQLASLLLANITSVQPKKNTAIPSLHTVLKLWLVGMTPNEMMQDADVLAYTNSPLEVSKLIEDVFGYKLPWALNAINAYFGGLLGEGEELPEVTAYFSSFFQYGVHSPVAASLLAFGVKPRKLALKLAERYVGNELNVQSILGWLILMDRIQLEGLGFDENEINQILQAERRDQSLNSELRQVEKDIIIEMRQDYEAHDFKIGQIVNVKPLPEISASTFSIHDLWGNHIGQSIFDQELLHLLYQKAHRIDIRCVEIWRENESTMLKLRIKTV